MIEIIPVEYGKSTLKESMVFYDGSDNKEIPIVFLVYLIKTETRTILVDAGCETMPGFKMKDFIGTVNALKKIGVDTHEITDLIITHAHHDHIECVKYFANAVIYIEKDEYESGRKYIPNGFKIEIFEESCSVCGDIDVLKIGGHSKGSCVVEIKKDNKTYVIVGDECYSRLCISEKRYTGSSFNEDASKEFVFKYSDEKYEILLSHDI